MIFNTWVFAFFSAAAFLIYWIGPTQARAYVLLIASYLFFTYHFPLHTLLILLMTAANYWISVRMFASKPRLDQGEHLPWHHHPKFYLVVMILLNVFVLAFYKYLKMILSTLNRLLGLVHVHAAFHMPALVVPLGLSFFVFEFIHYGVDVYQGKAKKSGFFQFALFIMYFPTLVSGPIKRYEPFLEQNHSMGRFQKEYFYEGLSRILVGLGKKVVLADTMTPYADLLLHPAAASVSQLWLGMYAYSMKIFFDFSGYSDIAIGTARLFGYRIPENFNYPYLQKNLSAFWNNWHMSLSSWIRDYIYIPLGGSRGSTAFAARNSLIAMAVSGLWHGAAWHFVVWGLYHGVGLAFLRYYQKWKKKVVTPFVAESAAGTVWGHIPSVWNLKDVLGILLTFHFVSFGWILFYCDFQTAYHDIIKMVGGILR